MTEGPLQGIRVLDMTTAWSGPFAGRILANLGADVIHVEAANRIDVWRGGGHAVDPIRYPDGIPGERPWNRTVMFNTQNINKRSLTVDVKKPGGLDVLLRLAAVSDVLLANFTPGTLDRMGLSPEALRKVNPSIVVLEMPAFGNSGPMANYVGLGPSMEFATGMGPMIGYGDGEPYPTGPAYLDPVGGYNAATAILIALAHREASGEGQAIEISQVEAAMPLIGEIILAGLERGEDPPADGNHRADAAPHNAYRCHGEHAWIAIAAFDEEEWRTLCDVLDRGDLKADPRFASLAARKQNEAMLDEEIAAAVKERDKHELADLLQARGVPAAPVQNGQDVSRDPYLHHRDFFTPLDHPEAGRQVYQGLPFHFSETPGGQFRASPLLGQHTHEILRDLGLSAEEVEALEQAGTIAAVPTFARK